MRLSASILGCLCPLTVIYDNKQARIYRQGQLLAQDSSTPAYTVWLPKLIGGTGSSGFVGRMAEMLFYNRALGDAERQQVETYLQDRYQCMPSYSSEMSSGQSSEQSSEESSSEESSSSSSSSSSSESSDDNNSSSSSGSSSSHALAVDFEVLTNFEQIFTIRDPEKPRYRDLSFGIPHVKFTASPDGPMMSAVCKVRISVPGTDEEDPSSIAKANEECQKWQLKIEQDVLTCAPGEVRYATGFFELTPDTDTLPGKDRDLTGVISLRFSGHNNEQTVMGQDNPGFPDTPLFYNEDAQGFPHIEPADPITGPLNHANRCDTFITRVYVVRDGTGEKRFLKWIKWIACWNVNFNISYNQQSGVTTAADTIVSWTVELISQGDGQGPEASAPSDFEFDFKWVPNQ
jgi:hypothetical protein